MKTIIKNLALAIILFAAGNGALYGQLSSNAVFTADEVVWYGLDFTNARFIGRFDRGFGHRPASEFELVNTYMGDWNRLVIYEPHNFDLKNTFRKKSVYYDINPVHKLNSDIKYDGLLTVNSHSIPKERLDEMVAAYGEGDKREGLGLVFIVENFNKFDQSGNFWVVFFDIRTRKILLSEHCSGAPMGFGLRNYWAGSIKQVLKDIRYGKYERWKRAAVKENHAATIG